MPTDPLVNDHYGDVLWKLNRKLQEDITGVVHMSLIMQKKNLKLKFRKFLGGLKLLWLNYMKINVPKMF